MSRMSYIVVVTWIFAAYFGLAASCGVAQDNPAKATGSIKGQITASGVRDVDSVVVLCRESTGRFFTAQRPGRDGSAEADVCPPCASDSERHEGQIRTTATRCCTTCFGTRAKTDRTKRGILEPLARAQRRIHLRQGRLGRPVVQRTSGNGRAYCGAAESVFRWSQARTAPTRLRVFQPASILSKPGTPIRRSSKRRPRRRR